ncbi:MAG TPA: DUF3048 domain-containing protein, partial [Acidimicrobiales bacterium]|nr:DUF3048 domain-containing protein [Acidimicrobiales bacterium]
SPVRVLAVLCALGLLGAACGGKSKGDAAPPEPTATTNSSTTTTGVPPPEAPKEPLTGLPSGDPAALSRPALVVKIDNADAGNCADSARPQAGIDQADVVYDILVEGITRYAAVFHSKMPEVIGPVRSARSSDIDIVAQLDTPLLAWSGNNSNVGDELADAKDMFVNVGHSSKAGSNFYRDKERCAPHNLMVNPADLYEFAKGQGGAPTPIFQYRAPGESLPPSAQAMPGVRLTTGQEVVYAWNATTSSWDRIQKRSPHLAADGKQISPANVVALEVDYRPSSTPGSPRAVTVGEGPAHVYSDGKLVDGTWKRDDPAAPWTLVDPSGAPIKLTPGTTWVELQQIGKVEALDAAGLAKFVER